MLRRSLLIIALLASAGAAQAGDRYGPAAPERETARPAPPALMPVAGRVLNWSGKVDSAVPQAADGQASVRPAPVSEWARRADTERTGRIITPAQGQIVPQSIYNRPVGQIVPQSIYNRPVAPAAAPAALPTSIFAPAPATPYRTTTPLAGAPIEIKTSELPDQPTLAQQMAADEAASVMEAKLARARLLDAQGRGEGVLIQSQDAVR